MLLLNSGWQPKAGRLEGKIALSYLFLSFFLLVKEKEENNCFNAETNDFDQWTEFGAPVFWSKYTTAIYELCNALGHREVTAVHKPLGIEELWSLNKSKIV